MAHVAHIPLSPGFIDRASAPPLRGISHFLLPPYFHSQQCVALNAVNKYRIKTDQLDVMVWDTHLSSL
jgi:hypothetical protein